MARNARGSDDRHDAAILANAEKYKQATARGDKAAADEAAAAIRHEVEQANEEHGG